MNTGSKHPLKIFPAVIIAIALFAATGYAASPWAKETTYWGKTRGKLAFGLKNSLLGWMAPWAQARSSKYKTEWEGFSAGFGEILVDTSAGLVQLATFFIPADFPDIGHGLPIPNPDWHPVMFAKSEKGQISSPEKVISQNPA